MDGKRSVDYCSEQACTGVHSHTHPYEEWCPRTRRAHADQQAKYKRTAAGMLTDVKYNRRRMREPED
jgi:hypothetical protein